MKKILILSLFLSSILAGQAQNKTMKTVKYPFEVHYASINDSLELAYFDEGTGPQTLIMIHGLGSYAPAWKPVIESLKGQYRCIALDLPGYGKSSAGDFPYSMSFFAETIAAFIDALGIENPTVVGHSMGGQIALTLALAQPNLMSKLVLVAPAGFETFSESDRQWFATFVTPEAILATDPARIKLNFAVNFHQMQFPDNAGFMYDDRMALKADSSAYAAYCNMIPKCVQGMLEAPVFGRLSELKPSTLVIYGEGDLLIPNKILHPQLTTQGLAEAAVAKIPNADLKLLPACGHFVQWECAEETASEIQTFITKK
ncbi:MAG: hypothetical protein Sapg2KO_44060 [Saprospiraceae bacterium]